MTRLPPPLVSRAVWDRVLYHERVARVVQRLVEFPAEPQRLHEAAAIACMEPSSFSRFFRQHIGVTYAAFRRSYRLGLAMERMARSDDPLGVIAAGVGYPCLATFERAFRKETGATPTSFRARLMRPLAPSSRDLAAPRTTLLGR